MQLLYAATSV